MDWKKPQFKPTLRGTVGAQGGIGEAKRGLRGFWEEFGGQERGLRVGLGALGHFLVIYGSFRG